MLKTKSVITFATFFRAFEIEMKTGLTEKNDGGKWPLSSNFDILYFRSLVNKKHPLGKK